MSTTLSSRISTFSPAQGEKTYIGSPNSAAGWSVGSGTVTVTTTTVSTNLPRATVGSAMLLSGGSTGDYVRYRFTADVADASTKLKWAFAMRPLTWTTSNDWKIEVWYTTDSTYATGLTQLTLSTDSSSITNLPNANGQFRTTFDTNTALYYELRFKRAGGTGNLGVADNICGAGVVTQGYAGDQWRSVTPLTITATTTSPTKGSLTEDTCYIRREGDSMHIRYTYLQTASGSAGVGTYLWSVPLGLTIDTTKMSASANMSKPLGVGYAYDGTNEYLANANVYDSTHFYMQYYTSPTNLKSTANISASAASLNLASVRYSFECVVPIAEWAGSGTVNLAYNGTPNASVTLNTGNGYGSTNTKIRRFTNATTVGTAITYADSATLGGTFTINEAGIYAITSQDIRAAGQAFLGVSVNSAALTTAIDSISVATRLVYGVTGGATNAGMVSWTGKLAVGDVVRAHTDGNPDNATDKVQFSIVKVASDAGQAVGFAEVVPGTSSGLVSASGLKGATAGTPVASSYVGELKAGYTTSLNNMPASGQYFDAQSITSLPAGVWQVTGRVMFFRSSASFTAANAIIGLSTTTGNSGTGLTQPTTRVDFQGSVGGTGFTNFTATIAMQIRSDGTNLYYGPSGSVTTLTGTNLYLKGSMDTYTGTPQYLASLEAVRIA